jgi:hypothetical protein
MERYKSEHKQFISEINNLRSKNHPEIQSLNKKDNQSKDRVVPSSDDKRKQYQSF